MKPIYAIRNDGIKYQELDLEILDITGSSPDNVELEDVIEFSLKNTSMKSWWPTPDAKFMTIEGAPPSPVPDISCWIDASLVLSPKAYRMLGDLLQPSGEFLPVSVGQETYYIFNCFVLGEADEDECEHEYADGMQLGLNHLEFKDSAAELTIFKSKFESCLTLFCNERFVNAVKSFGLNGIVFDENLIEVFG